MLPTRLLLPIARWSPHSSISIVFAAILVLGACGGQAKTSDSDSDSASPPDAAARDVPRSGDQTVIVPCNFLSQPAPCSAKAATCAEPDYCCQTDLFSIILTKKCVQGVWVKTSNELPGDLPYKGCALLNLDIPPCGTPDAVCCAYEVPYRCVNVVGGAGSWKFESGVSCRRSAGE